MSAVGRAIVVYRPHVVARIADFSAAYGVRPFPTATPEQLHEAALHVIERHRPFVLDRPRCGWCVEPWVCSSAWLAEQIRRLALWRMGEHGGDVSRVPAEYERC